MADHSFDPDVAEVVGVVAAILYKNIRHWCEKNLHNGKNIHDGKAWTYHSRNAFLKQFPYVGDKQLRTALERLEEADYIASGCFNKDNRDRTKWYCDLRVLVVPKGPMETPKRASPTDCQKGQPLPDNKNNNSITPLSPPKGKHGTRLSENWIPSKSGWDLALSLGVDPNSELEVFRDYWIALPGAKGRKLDWERTWNNWVRRAKPIRKVSGSEDMLAAIVRAGSSA